MASRFEVYPNQIYKWKDALTGGASSIFGENGNRKKDDASLAAQLYQQIGQLKDHIVNRKRVRRLMRLMGLKAIYRRPRTSRPAPGHKIYPYLLRGMKITRPNQVWAADITYIPMARGFLYLVAVINWYSRYVLSWRLSNTLDADFCVEALKEALRKGKPEIFDTEPGRPVYQ